MKSLPEIYKVGNREFVYDHKSLQYAFSTYRGCTNEEFFRKHSRYTTLRCIYVLAKRNTKR